MNGARFQTAGWIPAAVNQATTYTVYAITNGVRDLYIGQTTNLPARLKRHNDGHGGFFTRAAGGPWTVLQTQQAATRAEARCIEKWWTTYLHAEARLPFVTFKVHAWAPKHHHDHRLRYLAAVAPDRVLIPRQKTRAELEAAIRELDAAARAKEPQPPPQRSAERQKFKDAERAAATRITRLGFKATRTTKNCRPTIVLTNGDLSVSDPRAGIPRINERAATMHQALEIALAHLEKHAMPPREFSTRHGRPRKHQNNTTNQADGP